MLMPKYKYNYGQWHNDVTKLPDDINVIAFNAVSHLSCERLTKAIADAQIKRDFGEISVYDARDALVCTIEIHGGIFKTMKCTDDKIEAPLRVIFLRSHRNELVSFKSHKRR